MPQYHPGLPRAGFMCPSCGLPFDMQSPAGVVAEADALPSHHDRCPRCGVWFITHPPLQIELRPPTASVGELLQREEGLHFDFKEHLEASYFEKMARHITAFANAEGGEIFVGVHDRPRRFVGLFAAGDASALADYQRRLREGVLPKIKPTPVLPIAVFITDAETKRVGMLISIPLGSYPNYMVGGKAYIRREDKSEPHPLSRYEIEQREEEWRRREDEQSDS
jgi:hypothetical protein